MDGGKSRLLFDARVRTTILKEESVVAKAKGGGLHKHSFSSAYFQISELDKHTVGLFPKYGGTEWMALMHTERPKNGNN